MGSREEVQSQGLPATHTQRDDQVVGRIARFDNAGFVIELPSVPTGGKG